VTPSSSTLRDVRFVTSGATTGDDLRRRRGRRRSAHGPGGRTVTPRADRAGRAKTHDPGRCPRRAPSRVGIAS